MSLQVEIVTPDGTSQCARVFNLSASGMLIADLPFRPEVGDVHEYRLSVADQEIGLRGVVRRRQTIPQFGNAAGVAFVGLPERVRRALLDFLFGSKLAGASA
ncbi:MAG: PilZ domain-containing protein [Candidatus Sericytochromatia bacterium]|nr:PilZ domain-containing protein [Candidatus Tanganyikabacteria bacterium]